LNYEDPKDPLAVSTISFGEWDMDEVEGGELGLNYYDNSADTEWAVKLDDLRYDSVAMGRYTD
jgi:hypothetical protein